MKKILYIVLIIVTIISTVYLYRYVTKPTISVVMSTYNRADFLSSSIESILTQTMDDFEFIIINDGATDNTEEILKKYAKKDSRIKILTNTSNQGLIYSLNRGLEIAKGKYIARMDDDDISLPKRFERQFYFMENNPDVAVVASWIGNPKNQKVWPIQQETDPEKIKIQVFLDSVPIAHPAAFIRKSFIDRHHIRYDHKYMAVEDRKFWLDIIDAGGKITSIPEVLLLFRRHATNSQQYYIEQHNNRIKFYQDEILSRFADLNEFKNIEKCEVFKKIIEKNKTVNLLPQELLIQRVAINCPLNGEEKVSHPYWMDYFAFKGKRICRYKIPQECATILTRTKNILTVKWDRWGIETFEKIKDTWHLKK